MLTEHEKSLITKKINLIENAGENTGGSSHKSFTTITIDDINIIKETSLEKLIECQYTVIIETEFTYYPDNHPNETTYKIVIKLTDNKIFVESDKIVIKSNQNFNDKDFEADTV
ncbi:MAG: hypothetical protein Kow0068_19580 [Marinilabiliales bacterium]